MKISKQIKYNISNFVKSHRINIYLIILIDRKVIIFFWLKSKVKVEVLIFARILFKIYEYFIKFRNFIYENFLPRNSWNFRKLKCIPAAKFESCFNVGKCLTKSFYRIDVIMALFDLSWWGFIYILSAGLGIFTHFLRFDLS